MRDYKPITELAYSVRSVTCRTKSHNVTCQYNRPIAWSVSQVYYRPNKSKCWIRALLVVTHCLLNEWLLFAMNVSKLGRETEHLTKAEAEDRSSWQKKLS